MCAAVGVCVASIAHAAPVVGVTIDSADAATGAATGHYAIDLETAANGDGTYGLSGLGYDAGFQCNWDLTVNPDPQITSTFTLLNLSGNTQNFTMTITLPIATISPNTVRGGYFGDGVTGTTFTDTSGNGNVTLSSVGFFYTALVNNVVSQSLGTFSQSSSTSASLPQQAWGTPIPSQAFGAATTNMQIVWSFSLTGGDQVQTKGFFQVETPEPSTVLLSLLALGGLATARKLRR
ncbi:MAG TPA: PEP-CTERM sorting domain-containing protein [Myxococcota bacterium]|nr:PEP-CTERM sorting domain-containing protein [Myxococcota bacterium]